MKAQALFERVTKDLIDAIEAGASDWRMPWQCLGNGIPISVDGRPYRGWNALVLAMVAAERGWSSNRWATYRGWQRHGCQVRRGERSTAVVLWKPTDHRADSDQVSSSEGDHDAKSSRGLFARAFNVFAAEQVEGADRFARRPEPVNGDQRIPEVELYFADVGSRVVSGGDRACYVPALDEIHLPNLAQFPHLAVYYSTAAHEHVHWTGHESRLARDLTGRFGDAAYGAEELIAELGAAFWCAQFGLEQATRYDHAAYLADWIQLLRTDARALVAACGHAQRAVDHLNSSAGWTFETALAESA
jgi:antirestriction protein ArdC